MEKSIFRPLKEKKLTTLKIRYDYKTDAVGLYAAKEWDDDLDFSKYNHDFIVDGIFTENAIYLNTKEVWNLYEEFGLKDYLNEIINIMRTGKHFGLDAYYYDKYNIRFMMHEHSRRLGITNKSHAIMVGGIRRNPLEEAEMDVITNGLNMSRGMSFKNIAGSLPYGGCKGTVHMGPLDVDNMEVMGFLAFALDNTRVMIGPDMNFPTVMSDVMLEKKYSVQYTGGPSAKTGETGRPTAYGVYLSLLEAVKFYEGSKSLKGKSAAVMGLGAVGWHMAENLLKSGVSKLIVADIDPSTVEKFIDSHKEHDVEACSVSEIIYQDVDILSPCAIGGLFDENNIPKLKCKYIWGSANNQLKATSQEEEIRLANIVAEQGIYYQVEWWHNAGGIMCIAEEYQWDGTYETLLRKIEETLPANTWRNLEESRDLNITPTENCYRHCENMLYG